MEIKINSLEQIGDAAREFIAQMGDRRVYAFYGKMDATFLNNARAVHALWYANIDGGREGDYNGYFRNCSFIVDEDYIGTKAFHKHVDLAHVQGLDFWGCDFSAKRSVDSVSHYCMGIGAYEAGFRVDSYCTNTNTMPCPGEDLI